MANFFATYPPSGVGSGTVQTVQGEGTAGSPVGGVLTVQGDPAGTPLPVSGNITASSASVAPTGGAVPADADYAGMNVGGTLTGMTGSASGLNVVVNAALPAGAAIIGKVGIDQTTPGTTNGVQVNAALPAGANVIGAVTQSAGPWSVGGSGTAGTASPLVMTIQGIASMTPVKVDPSGGTGSVNVAQFGGSNVVTGTGTGGSGIPRVTVSSDSTLTSVGTVSTVTSVTAIANALPAGAAIIGKVGIDQTTPGTTNAVQQVSGTTAAWQAEGATAFGSITASYVTIFTPSAATKMIFMRNNTNAAISVSMDAGSTTNFIFDAGDQLAIDFVGNGLIAGTSAIQIKYAVGAPTSGSFRVNGVH